MSNIDNFRKPSPSLTRLVESAGILLGIPLSNEKSAFKAPLPSNYDQTIQALGADFYGCIAAITSLESADISNKMASQFYNKVLDPHFSYENSINTTGLSARDLFNAIFLVLIRLQSDIKRPPIQCHNFTAYIDGTRASYIALDVAAHVHSHGTLNIIAATFHESSAKPHLKSDIHRRCKSQYKKEDHTFQIVELEHASPDINEQRKVVQNEVAALQSDVFIMGLSDFNIGADSTLALPLWAAWDFPGDAVFSKGISTRRPFDKAECGRKFTIFVDENMDPKSTFIKALKFVRPGDDILISTIVKSRDPIGDNRESRYEVGARSGWINGPKIAEGGPNYIGWNDEKIAESAAYLSTILQESFTHGRHRIETENMSISMGKQLCDIAFDEASDFLVIHAFNHSDLIIQCVKDTKCTVIILK